MDVLQTIDEVRAWHKPGIGFVPTMGALHEGHAALMRRAAAENAHAIASVFVNPTQFGPNEDLSRYPRTLDADLALCEASGIKAVFTPDTAMVYPDGFRTWVNVDGLGDKLCGASRPGHFKGVTTVVAKLFNIVRPTRAYFGQKDAQQLMIIRRMTRDLDLPIEIVGCPIVREADGLAMSSRNRYLSEHERARAPGIYKALQAMRATFDKGTRNAAILHAQLKLDLTERVDKLDYAEILDAETLDDIVEIRRPALAAVACFIGSTRLIDNIVLDPSR